MQTAKLRPECQRRQFRWGAAAPADRQGCLGCVWRRILELRSPLSAPPRASGSATNRVLISELEDVSMTDPVHELPLYLRLRRALANAILDGEYRDGDLLPSVRSFLEGHKANPLTVGKAYQTLVEDGVVIAKRGVGFEVVKGGTKRLLEVERLRFLDEDWPETVEKFKRLQITQDELFGLAGRGSSATA